MGTYGRRGPAPALALLGALALASLSLCSGAELKVRRLKGGGGGGPGGFPDDPIFYQKWVIDEQIVNPDCQFDRPTAVVNGSLPGPEVTVLEGTRVIVEVENRQKYPVTIHWHGITQNYSQWHDGVPKVTQCVIEQGTTFTYNFSTWGHAGTMWWHTHAAMVRNSVLGSLNVESRPESAGLYGRNPLPVSLAGNATLILSDWYHESPEELETYVPFWGEVQTSLINGATYIKDAPASCDRKPMYELWVKPRRWYRLRVVNGALLNALNFAVQDHRFFLYDGEGGFLKPTPFRSYTVLSGQSYSFLLYTGQKPKNYWIGARPAFDTAGTPPGLALLRYRGGSSRIPAFRRFLAGPAPDLTADITRRTVAAKAPEPWINKVDRLVVLELNYDSIVTGGNVKQVHWSLNNVTLKFPPVPPLYFAYKGLTANLSAGYTTDLPPPGLRNYTGRSKDGFGTIQLEFGSVVQLVIQNQRKITMNPHPFHLHGHNFYVVGQGKGDFDIANWQDVPYNLKDPFFRNTGWVQEGGWTAVRFLADNPGAWLLHCHLEPHAEGGMEAVFYTPGPIDGPPADYPKCEGRRLS